MPDDIMTPGADAQVEVAEQDLDAAQEIEAGFADLSEAAPEEKDATTTTEEKPADGGEETSSSAKDGEEKGAAAEKDEGGEKKDGEAEGDESDPMTAILAKAEALEKEEAEAAKKQAEEEAAKAQKDGGAAPPQGGGKFGKMTREEAAVYLDFSKDILPEDPILVGDKEINFATLEEDVPGISDAIRIGSVRGANKLIRHLAEKGDIVTGAGMRQVVDRVLVPMQQKIEELEWMVDVATQDGTALQDIHSEEMQKWIKEQPAPVQRVIKSATAGDALKFVQAFREYKAKIAADEHDKKDRKNLDRQRDLHGHSASPTRRPASAEAGSAKAEEDAGFASVE